MSQRFLSLWFRHLRTDWFTIRRPALKEVPFVLTAPDHGRKIITAMNKAAFLQGIQQEMVIADARVLVPGLEVMDDRPELPGKLLQAMGIWCIRFAPVVAVNLPDGLVLDISGCAHLWGGERSYLQDILSKLRSSGYDVRGAIADTIGSAWAIARYGKVAPIIEPGKQQDALLQLPPAALRLEPAILDRLTKLGLYKIGGFAAMPRNALRRRFGKEFLLRLDQAFGLEEEFMEPVQPVEPYQERLPCLEPILTPTGIEIALTRLLEALCGRLQKEGKGVRTAVLHCFRTDGIHEKISIGTNRGSHHIPHLFKLFELKIPTISPGEGIDLFMIEATKVDDIAPLQEALWGGPKGLEDAELTELLDRIENKTGQHIIHRYLPAEHYWPERSFRPALALEESPASAWPKDRPRPIQILNKPEPIEVTAPIPDYPPMLFRYQGQLHTIKKADGPERIENEWWIEDARHRDYYAVEDETGARYWLFRSGHYDGTKPAQWYLHGFFA